MNQEKHGPRFGVKPPNPRSAAERTLHEESVRTVRGLISLLGTAVASANLLEDPIAMHDGEDGAGPFMLERHAGISGGG